MAPAPGWATRMIDRCGATMTIRPLGGPNPPTACLTGVGC